jgi:hypothetical protein
MAKALYGRGIFRNEIIGQAGAARRLEHCGPCSSAARRADPSTSPVSAAEDSFDRNEELSPLDRGRVGASDPGCYGQPLGCVWVATTLICNVEVAYDGSYREAD